MLLHSLAEYELADEELKQCSIEISKVLSLTEQEFRISQVQAFIENDILRVI
jgi:hypothetical protein